MNECHSISSFNLEVGRYLFWDGQRYEFHVSKGQSDSLIDSTEIGVRFRTYKRAFYKHPSNTGKFSAIDIKSSCLNAAFDMNYLDLISRHTSHKEKHNELTIESWFATQDKDLAEIARYTEHNIDSGFVIGRHKEHDMEEWSDYWRATEGILIDLENTIRGRLDALSDNDITERYYMTFANIKFLEAKVEQKF
jgi:hypothetical protein